MFIYIPNEQLELVSDLDKASDRLFAEGDIDRALAAHKQVSNICTTAVLAQIKLVKAAMEREDG